MEIEFETAVKASEKEKKGTNPPVPLLAPVCRGQRAVYSFCCIECGNQRAVSPLDFQMPGRTLSVLLTPTTSSVQI